MAGLEKNSLKVLVESTSLMSYQPAFPMQQTIFLQVFTRFAGNELKNKRVLPDMDKIVLVNNLR